MSDNLPAPDIHGLIIGPLLKRKSADQSAINVFKLLTTLGLRCSDIFRVYINPKVGLAKIELFQKDCEDYLVKVLKEVRSIMSLYDLRKLVQKPKRLIVVRIRHVAQRQHYQDIPDDGSCAYRPTAGDIMLPLPQNEQQAEASESNPPTNQAAEDDIPSLVPANNVLRSSETTSSMQIEFEELDEDEVSKSLRHEATSTSDIPALKLVQTQDPALSSTHKPIMVSTKTSTPIIYPCGCPDTVFYHQFQHIGAETRYAEFKKGGVIHEQRTFRNITARYVCGFLNTEGGALYLGVNDDGIVLGIKVNADMEETLRLDIDFAIRLIEPDVERNEYSVNFARIMEPNGEFSSDLKVLELCVKPRVPPAKRYSYNGVVYIRRDGSLQALPRESIRN